MAQYTEMVKSANTSYLKIPEGCASVVNYLFEIIYGKDGIETFCRKYSFNKCEVEALLHQKLLTKPLGLAFKKEGWMYESKRGFELFFKYPVLVSKHLIELVMPLEEFSKKYKVNHLYTKNFFNGLFFRNDIIQGLKEEGAWYKCWDRTPKELRELCMQLIKDEYGTLSAYLTIIKYPHTDSYWGYWKDLATPDKLEKQLVKDKVLLRWW